MITALFVFLNVGLADIIWALYIKAAANNHTWKAAVSSALIVAMGSFTVLEYTQNHWMVVPALLGAFVGTFVTIEYHKRKDTP